MRRLLGKDHKAWGHVLDRGNTIKTLIFLCRRHQANQGAIDTMALLELATLLVGFLAGYAARELVSRRRHKRWREKFWY